MPLNDNPDELKAFLDSKADLKSKSAKTLLLHVTNAECARLLLDAKADPNFKDSKGLRPLTMAKNIEIFRLLIEYEADPLLPGNKGEHGIALGPFLGRMQEDYDDMVEIYIKAGVDPNSHFGNHPSPLFRVQRTSTLKLLLDHRCDITISPSAFFSPPPALFHHQRSYHNVALLLEYNSDPNDTNGGTQSTILHRFIDEYDPKLVQTQCNIDNKTNISTTYTMLDIIKLLVISHADINAFDDDGDTPLDYAQHNDVIAYLVQNKAYTGDYMRSYNTGDGCPSLLSPHDSITTDTLHDTTLTTIEQDSHNIALKYMKSLIEATSYSFPDTIMYSRLFQYQTNSDFIKLLLDAKIDPNERNSKGLTPLFTHSYTLHIQYLLDARADPAKMTYEGSLLHYKKFQTLDTAILLIRYNADVNAVGIKPRSLMRGPRGGAPLPRIVLSESRPSLNAPFLLSTESFSTYNLHHMKNIFDALYNINFIAPLPNQPYTAPTSIHNDTLNNIHQSLLQLYTTKQKPDYPYDMTYIFNQYGADFSILSSQQCRYLGRDEQLRSLFRDAGAPIDWLV